MKKYITNSSMVVLIVILGIGLFFTITFAFTGCTLFRFDTPNNSKGVSINGWDLPQNASLHVQSVDVNTGKGEVVKNKLSSLQVNLNGEITIFDIAVLQGGIGLQPNKEIELTLPTKNENNENYIIFTYFNDNLTEIAISKHEKNKVIVKTTKLCTFVICEKQ